APSSSTMASSGLVLTAMVALVFGLGSSGLGTSGVVAGGTSCLATTGGKGCGAGCDAGGCRSTTIKVIAAAPATTPPITKVERLLRPVRVDERTASAAAPPSVVIDSGGTDGCGGGIERETGTFACALGVSSMNTGPDRLVPPSALIMSATLAQRLA